MMKWKVYFQHGSYANDTATTYVGAKTAKEALEEGATKLGIMNLAYYYAHAIPTGDPWEED